MSLRLDDGKQTLSKAAITTGSFTSGIGLSQEEADRFIDFVIDESSLKDKIRLERMNTRSKKIDVLNLAGKVLKPGTEVVDPGETVAISTRQIELIAKEVVAIVRISDDSLEDNIEGDDFADHLMELIAKAAANELEVANIYGRKLSPGSPTVIEQLWDGWRELILGGGHIVDASGAGFSDRFIDRTKMSALVKSLPTKFRKNKRDLMLHMSDDIDEDWANLFLMGRDTVLGDQSIEEMRRHRYRGIAFEPSGLARTDLPVLVSGGGSTTGDANEPAGETVLAVPSTTNFANGDKVVIARGTALEEVKTILSFVADTSITLTEGLDFAQTSGYTIEEATDDGADVILTNPKNLILGVQREMRVEPDRLPRLRATDWVLTMRVIPEIAEADAAAILEKLKVK